MIDPLFVSGDVDPTPDILTDASKPLLLYQLAPPPASQLLAVKESAAGTLRFELP